MVMLRPIGSSIAIGLSGLCVASLMSAGLLLGWVPKGDAPQVGLLILVTVVPMQALSSIFALLARDGATAGIMALMAATWATNGASHLSTVPGQRDHAMGLAIAAGGALIVLSGSTTARAKVLPGAAMMLAGTHFVLLSVYQLGGAATWQDIAGIVSLVVVAIAGYTAWAVELEDASDATVAPTLRRGRARTSIEGSFADQVKHVEHEAGVRQQL